MNIKDHEQAMKVHAAERYVLDELSPEERDDFEEHYFMCVKCAEEVRIAAAFADNAKSVFREDAATATLPGVAAKPRSSFHLRSIEFAFRGVRPNHTNNVPIERATHCFSLLRLAWIGASAV